MRRKIILIVIAVIITGTLCLHAEEIHIIPLFSPEDNCGLTIQEYISQAEKDIAVSVFYFTLKTLADELIQAQKRGVSVRVFLDHQQKAADYSKGPYLVKHGIQVRYRPVDTSGSMHTKFCVIDQKIVITGSFNWTVSADLKNDENMLIIESEKIASSYGSYFDRLWEGTVPDTFRYTQRKGLEKIPE